MYYARLRDGVTFERVAVLAATFDLTFFCPDPFSYAVEDEVFSIMETGSHTMTRAKGNIESNPVYRLKADLSSGSNRSVTISTNGTELKITNAVLTSSEVLVIDSAKMTAWVEDEHGNMLRNALPYIADLNFPVLNAGNNTISVSVFNAAFTELEIQAKSRWR